MSSTANVDAAEQAYRPPSDTPFLVGLGVISSVYVLLLIGLLAASYFLPGFSAFRWISQASRQMIIVLL